jgi:hypothetical protein
MLHLNTDHLLAMLYQMKLAETIDGVRGVIAEVHKQLASGNGRMHASDHPDDLTTMRRSYLLNELDQIHRTRTLERAHYYSGRLIKALTEEKTSKINDININRWKEYEHIHTDSLWVEERRDSSGAHTAGYWGNFIPQIPRQMMLRYTKQGEWVLDTFAGSGTTLIEGQRLGRHTIGVELQPTVADQAREYISQEPNSYGVTCDLITNDSTTTDFEAVLQQHGQSSVQLVMMHPPYHDIIVFSEDERDLSNAPSLDAFLEMIGRAVENAARVLDRHRYLILVIGDKYAKGEWIPLGFQAMQEVTSRGFLLKSIVVKNFGRGKTTGKRYQEELWRYRALVGGFYVFKHEYIFIFQKKR